VAGYCEYGDEPSGSGATELVSSLHDLPAPKIRYRVNNMPMEVTLLQLNPIPFYERYI
jgi:hypothetical protein